MKNGRSYYFIWFWVRLFLGFIFIYSGLSKLLVPTTETAALFYEYRLLPDFAVPWIVQIFPWVEFFSGSFLFFGIFTRPAVLLLLSFTCTFVILLGAERWVGGHFPGDCGCFAGSWKLPTPIIFLMDVVNLFLLLKLTSIKIHPVSLDALIRPCVKGKNKYHRMRFLVALILMLCMAGLVFGVRHVRNAKFFLSPSKKEQVQPSSLKQKGSSGAPVEIVEFTDFQCPACGVAQITLKQFEDQYPGKIKLIFKHYPLRYHQFAMAAHRAAECANSQGRFWPLYDLLYGFQRQWIGQDPAIFTKYAQALEMDESRFETCMKSTEPDMAIQQEIQEARQRQVGATPTFFINGERVVGSKELLTRGRQIIAGAISSRSESVPK